MLAYLHECATILGRDRRRLVPLVVYFVLASLLELLGLSLIAPFLTAIVAPDTFASLPRPGAIRGLAFTGSAEQMLPLLGFAIAGLFIVKAVSVLAVQRAIMRFAFGQQARLQEVLLSTYQYMPYEFHLQRNSAEVIHSITQLTAGFAHNILTMGLKMVAEGIVALAILTLLTIRAPVAVVIIALLLAFVVLLYDRVVRRRLSTLGVAMNRALGLLIKAVNHAIGGYKEISVLGRQAYFLDAAQHQMTEVADISAKFTVLQLLPRQMLETVVVIFMIVFTLVLLSSGASAPELVATLGIFAVAAARLVPTVNQIMSGVQSLRFNRNTVRRLYADLAALRQIGARVAPRQESATAPRPPEPFKLLELRNVSFQYQSACGPALHGIDLTIRPAEALGLIGPSGAGKSTLVNVILGFLPPQEGDILFNGRPLAPNSRAWLDQVAYIPQSIFLADDSLRRNVALGVLDEEIDDNRVMASLRQARLEQLVLELPNGLDRLIGEQGTRLSGGQRQRVALARAFYHGRNVLVLDEATSALDNDTEREIVEEIQRLRGTKTLIVIAHRLSTVANCDRIISLKDGQIVDQGSYREVVGQ